MLLPISAVQPGNLGAQQVCRAGFSAPLMMGRAVLFHLVIFSSGIHLSLKVEGVSRKKGYLDTFRLPNYCSGQLEQLKDYLEF